MLWLIKERNPGIQIIAVGDMKQKIYDKTTLDVLTFITSFLGEYSSLEFTKCFRLNSELADRLSMIWEKIVGVNANCVVQHMNLADIVPLLASHEPGDILCLGSRTGAMSNVLNQLETEYSDRFNKHTVYASITDEDRTVLRPSTSTAIFTTFDACKGLERKLCCVFNFTEDYWSSRISKSMTKYEILRNIFCVAASRGKEQIIFVRSSDMETPLSDKTLMNPMQGGHHFDRPFFISEMFDFKFTEQIASCYDLLSIKDISSDEDKEIPVSTTDCLIDISPCIGIWQEAAFFENYNIDFEILMQEAMHPYSPHFRVSKDATLDDKILIVTAYQTCHKRYVSQVSLPFVLEQQKKQILDRLGTVFDGKETVQRKCEMSFKDKASDETIQLKGKFDVMKDGVIQHNTSNVISTRRAAAMTRFLNSIAKSNASFLTNGRT